MNTLSPSNIWLSFGICLLVGLVTLDQTRGGPVTTLTRCNFLLSRSVLPAADVVLIGSSRSGAALDSKAIEGMLSHSLKDPTLTVERFAIARNTYRLSHSILENYLRNRGKPKLVVIELMSMSHRTISKLQQENIKLLPEYSLYQRDVNLMTFAQISNSAAVSMPYTESETAINKLRFKLQGLVTRAGALTYQFAKHPLDHWSTEGCSQEDMRREPNWPSGLYFGFDSTGKSRSPSSVIEDVHTDFKNRPKENQTTVSDTSQAQETYRYDFEKIFRSGEMIILESMVNFLTKANVPVILLPLPLNGQLVDNQELKELNKRWPHVHTFDILSQAGPLLDHFWFDDAHLAPNTGGTLTSAIFSQYVMDNNYLNSGLE